ncbi:uroporphyrinogen-III C-methyltransferase, partial [Candidatus Frankia datiscae]|uniref:uroporphyrinogen-III C-methyltransferase n=1 Tax=Candidatus Protofrankia californiensis TaxID=1839754 RepID=UPI001041B5A5
MSEGHGTGTADGSARVSGEVWLVGAGPGDPGLLTVRGRELLGVADVVVTDRLVSADVLRYVRPEAEIIHSGKSAGALTRTQDGVNALLVERALEGCMVVRLKGGDPFLLGRGGEEAEACRLAGVRCTVVPGVTAAFAAPAYAGIPVTHRGIAQDVAVVSGHLPPGHPDSTVDWAALGASRMTIVVLMGIARLTDVTAALIDGGRSPDTPVAVIERATTPAQRVVRGTLDAVAADAVAQGVRSPAVVVVGDVAARRDAVPRIFLRSDGGNGDGHGDGDSNGDGDMRGSAADPPTPGADADRPLEGVRVLVPRTRPRPGLLAARLRALGADAVETTVSRPGPVTDPAPLLAALAGADALVLAGVAEVGAVVALLRRAVRDTRALAGLVLVAADPEAEVALEALGLSCVRSLVSVQGTKPQGTEQATEYFGVQGAEPVGVQGAHRPLLVPGSASGTPRVAVCASALPPAGAETVRRISLLTDIVAEPDPRIIEEIRHGDLHAAAFASSTAARATVALYGPLPAGIMVAAMGQRTAAACRHAGIRV